MGNCWKALESQPDSISVDNCSMAGILPKTQILIITDSRGAWLSRELRNLVRHNHIRNLNFYVIYRKGAGLALLWEIAEHALLSRKVDILLMFGGICDITSPTRDAYGRRSFWPSADLPDRMDYIIDIMKGIVNNFELLQLPCKMCFMPEPGADLIRYNRLQHPVDWRYLVIQNRLEDYLVSLRAFTRRLNADMKMPTPWTLDATHTRRNGRLVQVYSRFRDGLHPSLEQVKKWAEIIISFVQDLLTDNGNNEIEQNR